MRPVVLGRWRRQRDNRGHVLALVPIEALCRQSDMPSATAEGQTSAGPPDVAEYVAAYHVAIKAKDGEIAALRTVIEAKDGELATVRGMASAELAALRNQLAAAEQATEQARREAQEARDAADARAAAMERGGRSGPRGRSGDGYGRRGRAIGQGTHGADQGRFPSPVTVRPCRERARHAGLEIGAAPIQARAAMAEAPIWARGAMAGAARPE